MTTNLRYPAGDSHWAGVIQGGIEYGDETATVDFIPWRASRPPVPIQPTTKAVSGSW